jgi:probable HAF family extracellular repeat protein
VGFGVNNSDDIVGYYNDAIGTHGFLYVGENFMPINPLGASSAGAVGINDSGNIVGYYNDDTGNHGFLYVGGDFTTINALGAYGINKYGNIVGYYSDATGDHGFLYVGGNFTTVDFPGALHTYAFGINDSGNIVGKYNDATGQHGFVASPIPEPVAIDIKPGDASYEINLKRIKTVSVAILSAPGFDAFSDVNQATLTFGFTGDEPSLKSCARKPKDVDGVGLKDLVCTFTVKTAFQCNYTGDYTRGILRGQTKAGIPFEGNQEVATTPSCIH